jgi:hypothetical protein
MCGHADDTRDRDMEPFCLVASGRGPVDDAIMSHERRWVAFLRWPRDVRDLHDADCTPGCRGPRDAHHHPRRVPLRIFWDYGAFMCQLPGVLAVVLLAPLVGLRRRIALWWLLYPFGLYYACLIGAGIAVLGARAAREPASQFEFGQPPSRGRDPRWIEAVGQA